MNFDDILHNAAETFYTHITEDRELMKQLAKCEGNSAINECLSEYSLSDRGFEMLDDAADSVMLDYSSVWSILMVYVSDPSDILQNKIDGLDIYSQFEDDIVKETKKLVHKNIDKLKEEMKERWTKWL